jgi:predicted nucleic acid-binding protein
VADRRLILDANILVRAVLGTRVRTLIEQYAGAVQLLAPDTAFAEVEEHLPAIFAKRSLPAEPALAVYARVSVLVQELPLPFYADQEAPARTRLAGRDVEDWPVLACALTLECPVWTEDRDFFGTGIPLWASDLVEIYMTDRTPARA